MAWEKHVLPQSRNEYMIRIKRCLLAVLALGLLAGEVVASPKSATSADQALRGLLEGNQRFVCGQTLHPHSSPKERLARAKEQHPFAVILCCADSRVSPELLFDEGIGDLFVSRVAGNIVDDSVLGSIEYAVEHLGVPLVVVLGHERCGAVAAAVAGGHAPGHIHHLVQSIQPAVKRVKGRSGDTVDNAVRANVQLTVTRLKQSRPILANFVAKGKVKVVGARYDLDTGKVELI